MAPGMPAPRLLTLDPHSVELDPQGTRTAVGEIGELAASIAAEGILQPIGVRAQESGRFRVVYGGRRLAAARHLGLAEVPCLVIAGEGDPLVQQIAENVQRRELGDMEKARAFARLGGRIAAEQPGLRGSGLREEIGTRLGISGRTVGRYLALLELPQEVQDLIDTGDLSVTQAQHLLAVAPRERQVALAREATERGLSAAQISRASTRLATNGTLSVEAAVRSVDGTAAETAIREQQATPPAPPAPARLPRAAGDAAAGEGAAEEAEFWADDASAEQDGPPFGAVGSQGLATEDKARVFRIRSLDSFVDEVARLTRCVQDGDLARLVESDPGAEVKITLAARQIGFLARAVNDLVEARRR